MRPSPSSDRRRGGAAGLAARLAVLLLLALVCAALANLVGPRRIPWFENWSQGVEAQALELGIQVADAAAVRRLVDAGEYMIFDARPEIDYQAGHLPGALPLPSDDFDFRVADYLPLLYPEQPLLVYCSGTACDESIFVSRGLLDMGFTNIVLFAGGTRAWTEAGFELETMP